MSLMSPRKRTGGEWKVQERASGTFVFSPTVGEVAEMTAGNQLMRTANARLIAAAPELLRACEAIVEWRGLIKQDYPDMDSLLRGIDLACQAIRKATGE